MRRQRQGTGTRQVSCKRAQLRSQGPARTKEATGRSRTTRAAEVTALAMLPFTTHRFRAQQSGPERVVRCIHRAGSVGSRTQDAAAQRHSAGFCWVYQQWFGHIEEPFLPAITSRAHCLRRLTPPLLVQLPSRVPPDLPTHRLLPHYLPERTVLARLYRTIARCP